LRKKRILVIDDKKQSLNLCKKLLGELYRVIPAENSGDGIKAAIRQSPDLILVDLNDNFEKGLSLCRKFTRRDATWKIPLVIICESSHAGVVERTGSLSVVDYIPKPIRPALLIKLVQTTLERYSGSLTRCRNCLRSMRAGWAFCPYDGAKLPESGSG
jgi:CheY-like chemotaxis protein